jgi:DNA modification methylase
MPLNRVILADCKKALKDLDSESVHLVFSSPPYFNIKEYASYANYTDYLAEMRLVFSECHRILKDGCFFVINSSPVLVPRESRNKASKRLPIPFDLHAQITSLGFDFIDDIIWVKPEGAGWVSGRGRRFSADRNPLQYKTVPVTEYVMVYRKHSSKLIDWNIRSHDAVTVRQSKITGTYDVTNVWQIPPANDSRHPAIFPLHLAERVIRYYSFKGDIVLDPFAGIGTTGKAAKSLGRNFVLIERDSNYVDAIKSDLTDSFGSEDIAFINC